MKRLILAAAIAALTLVVGPIASASANHSVLTGEAGGEGKCEIEGKATFSPGLGLLPIEATFKFESNNTAAAEQLVHPNECLKGEATEYEENGTEVTGTKKAGNFVIGIGEAKVEHGGEKCIKVAGGKYASNHCYKEGAPSEWEWVKDNAKLECGTQSKDGTADSEYKGGYASLTVKGPAGGAERIYAPAISRFTFVAKEVPGEIEVKLDAKFGGGSPNKAHGYANFTEPGNAAAKKDTATKCQAHTAGNLKFETAATKAAITEKLGRSPAVGLEGKVGEKEEP